VTRVLIVEDEPAILRMLDLMLRAKGYETVTAADAETATGLLGPARPDIVIADVRLPGMDGVELTQLIKGTRRMADVPVVLISAFEPPRRHQADAFLPKPFDIDQLEGVVSEYARPTGGR
jgi:CheY-like chemotaxis protein